MILLELPVLAISWGFFSGSDSALYAEDEGIKTLGPEPDCTVPGKVALLAGGPGLGVPGWAEGNRGLS